MTHFNHEWDGSPAIPEAVGDRYYAQDLNDDFNYLKHLPYEVFLQGRSRGVMIAPSDTWDNDTNSLTLSGGFGVILQDNLCVDPDEDFVVPPITKSSPRYERVPLVDTTLILPNDSATHYIVATPTKRSLLQRIKTVLSESYASRIRYDGVITIQDIAPTAGQILIGLCHNKEYCLLIDNDINQCKENIILHKWFGQNKLINGFVTVLQTYYDTLISSISTSVIITIKNDSGVDGIVFNKSLITINEVGEVSAKGIGLTSCTLNNCTINISNIYNNQSRGFVSCTLNNCIINFTTNTSGIFLSGCTLNNCIINVDTINTYLTSNSDCNNCKFNIKTSNASILGGGNIIGCIISVESANAGYILAGSISNNISNCTIMVKTVNGGGVVTNVYARICNCYFYIDTINSTPSYSGAFEGGYFLNCAFCVETLKGGIFIDAGRYQDCAIKVVNSTGGTTIYNSTSIWLHLVHAELPSVPTLNNIWGKAVVVNETTVKSL